VCVHQDTLLELLCDAVASSVRQGKGLVVSGFPRDLRQAEEYEAKARAPECRDTQQTCGQKDELKMFSFIHAKESKVKGFRGVVQHGQCDR